MKENVSEEQFMEACEYVDSYFRLLGFDEAPNKRPNKLPDDVSKAWDVIDRYFEEYDEGYGIPPEGR